MSVISPLTIFTKVTHMILHTPPTYTPVYCQGFQTIIKDKVILSYIKTDTVGNCIKKLIEKLLLKQFF